MKLIATHKKTGEVKEFSSLKDASISLDIQTANISQCLHGKKKSAGGYIWARNNEPTLRENKRKRKDCWKHSNNTLCYWYTPDRKKYKKKYATYNDKTGILQVHYNTLVPMKDGQIPDLEKIQEKTKNHLQSCYGRCIFVNDGGISKKGRDKYFIYSQLTAKVPTIPTEKSLRAIEREINSNLYYIEAPKEVKRKRGRPRKTDKLS